MTEAMPHQARVIPDMLRGNKMLVWEPGTGKTYPVLVAAMFLDGPTLVICPAHLREQWKAQAREHTPLLRVVIWQELNKEHQWQPYMDVVVCSYEFASHLPRWKELRQIKWAAIAIDEAHYLMNLDANRTRAILGLKPLTEKHGLVFGAELVWSLTGTPFQFPNQIYPLLSALFPKCLQRPAQNGPGLMTAREWENEYCIVKRADDGFGDKIVGAKNIPELRARLSPFLDKVRLTDVVKDMPPLTIDTIPIRGKLTDLTKGLSPELINAYKGLTDTLLDDSIPDDEKLEAVEESGLVMAQLRHHIAIAKIKQTLEIIRGELEGGVKKILLLGWHTRPLIEVAEALDAPIIYGDLTSKAKALAKEEFIEDPRCHVLCGQVSAVATGTDGLQAVCHRGLFMETPWTFRDNKQAWHRLYRKGQKLPVHWSYITLLGSVDEYVARVFRRNAEIVKLSLD
jgi:hypothetical protein